MFRELVRFRQKLTEEECRKILHESMRGVLSVNGDDGYPYGIPLNHYYSEADNRIYFHSGRNGHKMDALKQDDRASYCVLNEGVKEDGGWALNFKSVIVFGRIEVIDEPEVTEDITRKLSHKFTDDEAYIDDEILHSLRNTVLLALNIEHMCGKRVNEK